MHRPPSGHGDRGARVFGALARGIVRRPLVPIVVWIVLLVVCVPFLSRLSSVTTNSAESAPSHSPSAQAAARFAALFPNETGGSSTILLFYGTNLTDAAAQSVLLQVTAALAADRALVDIGSISSVYSSYASYLAGQAQIGAGAIASGLASSPTVPEAVNASAAALWGPAAAFVANWQNLSGNDSRPPDPQWNPAAYNLTAATYANSSFGLAALDAFYFGAGSAGNGFNGTAACAALPSLGAVLACADGVGSAVFPSLLPSLPAAERPAGAAAIAILGLGNFSGNWTAARAASAVVLGNETGLPGGWVDRVWARTPTGALTPAEAAAWATGLVANATLAQEPLPVPFGLRAQYVNTAGTASLVSISFTVSDSSTNASGANPVDFDLGRIDADVGAVLALADPAGTIQYVQTGPAPLDALTQQAVNSSLALVLPLTVGLLLAISMIYFRSPVAPLVTFGGLAIALVLGLGGTVLVGTLVTHVDSSALALEEVFVLGVGTDYSIFLVARYREEILRGRTSDEAIVASVSWAGQSVATSGSTAILVTAALAFSGVALLSQWGMVLSIAILITMLLSLTVVPAALKLLGPRIFWPMTGDRLRRQAAVHEERARNESTYFHRAGRATSRHPRALVGALLLVTIPLALLAVTVPVSYDFYAQLPGGHSATDGLAQLNSQFGPGFATQSFALVTFASPLLPSGIPNATEFSDLANLTAIASGTSGIVAVQSPIGPYGAPLSEWLALPSLKTAPRENLLGLAGSYVGNDGRTVVLTFQTSATGLSHDAVIAVDAVEAGFGRYASGHAEVASLAYGGGAPTIQDLANETNQATLLMILAVTVGLITVLLVVLRSWIIALMAVGSIGLSIAWAWALTYLIFQQLLGLPLFFYVRTILFVLILGLGIDYNIFLLTRVREERLRGRTSGAAAVEAVARTGGIITAAAIILASAFASLFVGEFTLIRAIGFSVALAVILDAMVVRTYLVPAALQLLGDRVWTLSGRKGPAAPPPAGERDADAPGAS